MLVHKIKPDENGKGFTCRLTMRREGKPTPAEVESALKAAVKIYLKEEVEGDRIPLKRP